MNRDLQLDSFGGTRHKYGHDNIRSKLSRLSSKLFEEYIHCQQLAPIKNLIATFLSTR